MAEETTLTPEQLAQLEAERQKAHREAVVAERKTANRPFPAFRFLVYFEDSAGSSNADNAVKCAFTNFSGIKMTNQIFQMRSGDDERGVQDNYPGITTFDHVKLTKGVIGKNDFLDWLFNACMPGTETAPQGKKLYRNIRVVSLMEHSNDPGMEWTLINAIPIGYELHPMDASQSGYLSEEIEIAFTGVKRTSLWQADEDKDKK